MSDARLRVTWSVTSLCSDEIDTWRFDFVGLIRGRLEHQGEFAHSIATPYLCAPLEGGRRSVYSLFSFLAVGSHVVS